MDENGDHPSFGVNDVSALDYNFNLSSRAFGINNMTLMQIRKYESF
jgi:hypothetical protein